MIYSRIYSRMYSRIYSRVVSDVAGEGQEGQEGHLVPGQAGDAKRAASALPASSGFFGGRLPIPRLLSFFLLPSLVLSKAGLGLHVHARLRAPHHDLLISGKEQNFHSCHHFSSILSPLSSSSLLSSPSSRLRPYSYVLSFRFPSCLISNSPIFHHLLS